MNILVVLGAVFALLLAGVYSGIPLVYPLLLGLGCFAGVAFQQGFGWRQIGYMAVAGAKKSLVVIKIFILIGAITAAWRASGTVACIVYYGIAGLSAHYFLVCAFLLCCLVSFMLGTSFGTVGTMGVVLAIMAQSGGIDINMAAGAIIAGAYFGDRCSPMSSSAALVAVLTETDLYVNIKNMMRSAVTPFLLSVAAYAGLSYYHPLIFHDNQMIAEISRLFDIGLIVLLPAAIMLAGAFFRIDVKLSMAGSITAAVWIAVIVQHEHPLAVIRYLATGYTTAATGVFAGLIEGGGLISMLNAAVIVLLSSAYAGIFEGTKMLSGIEHQIARLADRTSVFAATLFTSVAASAFGCNQTLACIVTHQVSHKLYWRKQLDNGRLALDLENSVIVVSALVPWNIAGAIPAAVLSADAGFIVYAVYLFLIPAVVLCTSKN